MNTQVETQTKTKEEIIEIITNEFEEDDLLPFEHGFPLINIRGHKVWAMDKNNIMFGGGTLPYSMLSEKELNKVYNAYQTYINEKY